MIHQRVYEIARTFPARIAIEGAGLSLRYDQLLSAASHLTNEVSAQIPETGARVVLLLEDRALVISAMLACLSSGQVFVPLDSSLPMTRLQSMCQLVSPSLFVCEPQSKALAESLAALTGAKVMLASLRTEATSLSVSLRDVSVGDPAYVSFTSGSTGQPKAILGRVGAIDHFITWEKSYLSLEGEACRVSQLTHPAYDAFLRDAFLPLCVGGVVCVPEGRLAGADLFAYLVSRDVRVLHTVPSIFRTLLTDELDLSRLPLRHVLLAGEALLPSDARRWLERTQEKIALTNLYGPSETTMVKLFHQVGWADIERGKIPIGKPMPETRVILVDDHGTPTKGVGEILIQTPHASLGYFGDPQTTAKAFVQDPTQEQPSILAYKTGDFGRALPDGSLEFLGRKDRQVKVRGVRVELDEVEGALAACPGVRECAVIAREEAQGGTTLCAYVAPEELVEAELRRSLAARLPAGHMPQLFVQLPALPKTISNKIDRRALPDPALIERRSSRGFLPPETPLEKELAMLWSSLLGLKEISLSDNFFELGGDSLLATRLLSQVAEQHGARVKLVDFLEQPTLRELSLQVLALRLEAQDPEELERLLLEAEAEEPTFTNEAKSVNIEAANEQEEAEARLAEFYGRFPWPWEAAAFDVIEEPLIETLFRNQDVGDFTHRRIPEDGAIWVAGCGVNQAVLTALRFPFAKVLGTDLSETSLAKERETARKLGIQNLELSRESIADARYTQTFDQVICTGVIHHNPNPKALLDYLGRALKPKGILELMVYNRFHRQVTSAFQEAVRTLCLGDGEPLQTQLAVATRLLQLPGVREGLSRAFTQFMEAKESDLADLLIQPIEQSYTIKEVSEMARECGLSLLAPCVSAYARHLDKASWELEFLEGTLKERYQSLPDVDRWQTTQLLLHERSPLIWFYLERAGEPAGEVSAKQVAARMLNTRFRQNATQKRSYVRRPDGRYEPSAFSVPFPAVAPHPSVRRIFEEATPERTLAQAIQAAKLEADWDTVARARRLLTTSAFPYLLAEGSYA